MRIVALVCVLSSVACSPARPCSPTVPVELVLLGRRSIPATALVGSRSLTIRPGPLGYNDLVREADAIALQVTARYERAGFARVDVAPSSLTPGPDRARLALAIDEGPRFRLRSLRLADDGRTGSLPFGIEGPPPATPDALSGLAIDDWFSQAALDEGIARLCALYREHGYAAVTVIRSVSLDPSGAADVQLEIVRGPLAHLRAVEVRDERGRRLPISMADVGLEEQTPFVESRVERAGERLRARFPRATIGRGGFMHDDGGYIVVWTVRFD